MRLNLTRVLNVVLAWFCIVTFPSLVYAQSNRTITQTQTSTMQNNNAVFGCESCRTITSQTDPHPDTSVPIFSGDPRASALPSAIAQGLPPNNQFGNGVPSGSSGLPINQSTGVDLSQDGVTVSTSNSFTGIPDAAGGRTNVLTQSINQVVPGGDSASGGLADQEFAVHFQVTSLTDPDGHMVGAATGTATQTLNGVQTNTTFTFDPTNGLVPSQPFPNPTTGLP